MKLYIGSNQFKPEGWTTIDLIPDYEPDIVDDACVLSSIQDNTADSVYCGHLLEHVADPWQALLTWHRVLKPGGVLTIVVPDHEYSVKRWLGGENFTNMLVVDGKPAHADPLHGFLGVVAGHMSYKAFQDYHSQNPKAAEAQIHLRSLDKATVYGMMEACGFEGLEEVTWHEAMTCVVPWQFGVSGRKAE